MDLWQACGAETTPSPLDGTLFRLVESQEQVATNNLVDSFEEQSALERLLDVSKPPPRAGTEGLHYLLQTPFRYPPLRHGSRFGQRHEPSIFYGSLSRDTALSESAYYRLVFWYGQADPPTAPYTTQHTLIEASYATAHGLQLQGAACADHRAVLTDPADYGATQKLGARMRDAGIKAFEFPSARCPRLGENVGLFEPVALSCTRPTGLDEWLCYTSGERVAFLARNINEVMNFSFDEFAVGATLPQPAV